jgi:hypothetical protein
VSAGRTRVPVPDRTLCASSAARYLTRRLRGRVGRAVEMADLDRLTAAGLLPVVGYDLVAFASERGIPPMACYRRGDLDAAGVADFLTAGGAP